MRSITFSLISAALISSCAVLGHESHKERPPGWGEPIKGVMIDPRLGYFVADFFHNLKVNGFSVDLSGKLVVMSITEMEVMYSNIVGMAMGMWDDERLMVLINSKQWRFLSLEQKQHVIWHELGHDLFNLTHEDDAEHSKIMEPKLPAKMSEEELLAWKIQFCERLKKSAPRGKCWSYDKRDDLTLTKPAESVMTVLRLVKARQ